MGLSKAKLSMTQADYAGLPRQPDYGFTTLTSAGRMTRSFSR
jgi:hypothetical protein